MTRGVQGSPIALLRNGKDIWREPKAMFRPAGTESGIVFRELPLNLFNSRIVAFAEKCPGNGIMADYSREVASVYRSASRSGRFCRRTPEVPQGRSRPPECVRVGLFQQQGQTCRIVSPIWARVFTICDTEPRFTLCYQYGHFH